MNILEIGRETMLVEQVCCKLKKNKSVKQIAEDLENDETLIAEICDAANGFAPDYDPVQVYQNWKKSRSIS